MAVALAKIALTIKLPPGKNKSYSVCGVRKSDWNLIGPADHTKTARELEVGIDFIALRCTLWKEVGESWSIASIDVRGIFACT